MAARTATPQRARGGGSSRRRRSGSSSASRAVVADHRDELAGLAAVAAGVLVALAIWARVAGPAGEGVDHGLGAVVGLARYVLPIALVVLGVALVRNEQIEHRARIAVGGGLIALAVLGILHVVRGPDRLGAPIDELAAGGGAIGAVVAEPVQRLVGPVGTFVLLLAALVAGVVVLTRRSVVSLASGASRVVRAGAVPLVRVARRAANDVSTLASERLPTDGPELYDHATVDDTPPPPPPPKGRSARRRSRAAAPPWPPPEGGSSEQLAIDLGPGVAPGRWRLPPANTLTRTTTHEISRAEVEARGRQLEDALGSHGVETRLIGMTVGPTVTRYELELGPGVKVAKVTALHRDIAYAMAAVDVRILAPIPGRSAIGVEVPNHSRQLVALGDLLASPEAKQATHPLDVAVGKDIAGRSVFLNLATTPHLLIAGATGAGKSSGINTMITSILMRSTPEQVRLILVDPKQVEMGQYARLPHLLTQPVTNPKKAANALAWAVREMDRRYDLLFEVGFRDVTGYNAAFDRGELQAERGRDTVYERLPFIVVVVDELNDLMMVAARDVEDSITRIAQKARAVGIHLIVATQRPSVNVITGVIKANVPARVSYAVSSLTDSRVILDQSGAERLVGKGDMLLLPGNSNVAQRIQGAFVNEEEIRRVVAHWRRQAPEPVYVAGIEGDDERSVGDAGFSVGDGDDDEALVRQAMELVVRSQLGSTSMLQRKLKVGFARAGRLMDLLEQRGVVGPSEGSKARSVLMTPEELDLLHSAERD
jgi:S-DNA-T family DNA segregation ATPase FtsK/SpoIIIE